MQQPSPDPHILELFQAEAAEHLAVLNAELLQVEREPAQAADALKKLLRAAHSLKGTAAAAGLTRIERWMHNGESCAQALARGRAEASSQTLDLLYQLFDAIEAEVQKVCTGERPAHAPLPPSAERLREAFGADLQLFESTSVAPPEDVAGTGVVVVAPRPDDAAMLRVGTGKVDRLMADIEELVQAKVVGLRLIDDVAKLGNALQALSRELQLAARTQVKGHATTRGAKNSPLLALRQQAEQSSELCSRVGVAARRHSHQLGVLSARLQSDVRSVRMVPARPMFASFSRMVRDLSRRQDKRATLRIEGADTEVDRDLLEALRDPVMHLLRNAVAHGIETPAERAAAGKAEEGTIVLAITSRASGLDITVSDDGRGIDRDQLRAVLVSKRLASREEAAAMPDGELERFLFLPGFSTATSIDAVSGRGVGLDVVREAVERCGGTVKLQHEQGHGTTFALRLPLSLTALRVLLVSSGGTRLAIPVNSIVRIVRIERGAVRQVDSGPAIELQGNPVVLSGIRTALGQTEVASQLDRVPAVVVEAAGERCALTVDAIDGEQELVVISLGDYLQQVPCIAGATLLASGEIVPTLNVAAVVRRVVSSRTAGRVFAPQNEHAAERKRVLIADDSITTRSLERSILEAVGYSVEVATDGQDALAKLRAQQFDLLLSDVQMPRMDGIELVTRVRAEEGLRTLKVVLVSSLASDEDRKRGLTAGADAYIGKGEFRQELLLQTLERLL